MFNNNCQYVGMVYCRWFLLLVCCLVVVDEMMVCLDHEVVGGRGIVSMCGVTG